MKAEWIAQAVLGSRLGDALEVWMTETRAGGGIAGRDVAILHDLFDTVGEEIAGSLDGGAAPDHPVPDPAGALRALAAGLAGLRAALRRFRRWSRGSRDPELRRQAACVARRADGYAKLVEEFGKRGFAAGGRTGRGVSPVPGAGPGADSGFGILVPFVLPAAPHHHSGGDLREVVRQRPPFHAGRKDLN